jgi:hypothetical protein
MPSTLIFHREALASAVQANAGMTRLRQMLAHDDEYSTADIRQIARDVLAVMPYKSKYNPYYVAVGRLVAELVDAS